MSKFPCSIVQSSHKRLEDFLQGDERNAGSDTMKGHTQQEKILVIINGDKRGKTTLKLEIEKESTQNKTISASVIEPFEKRSVYIVDKQGRDGLSRKGFTDVNEGGIMSEDLDGNNQTGEPGVQRKKENPRIKNPFEHHINVICLVCRKLLHYENLPTMEGVVEENLHAKSDVTIVNKVQLYCNFDQCHDKDSTFLRDFHGVARIFEAEVDNAGVMHFDVVGVGPHVTWK